MVAGDFVVVLVEPLTVVVVLPDEPDAPVVRDGVVGFFGTVVAGAPRSYLLV